MANPAASEPSLEPGVVRLEAGIRTRAAPDTVAAILRGPLDAWLGGAEPRPAPPGLRRHAVDLELRIGSDEMALVTLRKAALVDLGPVGRRAGGYELPIGWRAATAAPLFPVFSGRLVVDRDELRISGLYAPPGGRAGRMMDRVLLHTAAHGTARWMLRQLDRAATKGRI